MEVIAHYPIQNAAVEPHVGRPVGAVLPNGDVIYGTVDRLHDGHLVLRPMVGGASTAAVQRIQKQVQSNPRIQALIKKSKNEKRQGLPADWQKKANTKAYGYGGYGGYGRGGYGWGYGNYGWGAGWWWIWPLFWIAALVAFPFFW